MNDKYTVYIRTNEVQYKEITGEAESV